MHLNFMPVSNSLFRNRRTLWMYLLIRHLTLQNPIQYKENKISQASVQYFFTSSSLLSSCNLKFPENILSLSVVTMIQDLTSKFLHRITLESARSFYALCCNSPFPLISGDLPSTMRLSSSPIHQPPSPSLLPRHHQPTFTDSFPVLPDMYKSLWDMIFEYLANSYPFYFNLKAS